MWWVCWIGESGCLVPLGSAWGCTGPTATLVLTPGGSAGALARETLAPESLECLKLSVMKLLDSGSRGRVLGTAASERVPGPAR